MLGRRLAAAAAAVSAMSLAAGAPSASAAEAPTPQAVAANAEFLAYAPPPPVPAKVCVVDTGVDLTTDAAPAVVERHSVFGGTTDDVGGSGLAKHGTFVAGVIASQLDGRDSVGIWPHARIVSVRVFEGSGGGTSAATVITALERCRERGVTVINISLSGLDQATGDELAELEDRLTILRHKWGVSVVAGAGNGAGPVSYPARFDAVLAVAATDGRGALCPFSNRGHGLDLMAVGCSAALSWPGGGVGAGTGTSYSSPVVSAVLAALRAYRPDLSVEQSETILLSTAASGRIDARAAFLHAGLPVLSRAEPVTPPPSFAATRPRAAVTDASKHPLVDLGVRPPRLRSATFRRGLLRVRVAGVPDYGRALFTVGSRKYARSSGLLRARLRRPPKRLLAAIDVPGVGTTRSVSIRPTVSKSPTPRPRALKK